VSAIARGQASTTNTILDRKASTIIPIFVVAFLTRRPTTSSSISTNNNIPAIRWGASTATIFDLDREAFAITFLAGFHFYQEEQILQRRVCYWLASNYYHYKS
jgi:hypothetical protein